MGNQATFIPPAPIFDRLTDTKVDTNAGYENFELLYNGTDGKSVFVTYREYTSDNLARPAYFQNLTYDSNAGTIRFKKFRIRVVKATSEALSYVVLEDGR